MTESIDSYYSFTPHKPAKQKHIQFEVSEDVKRIIANNMTPFKQRQTALNQYQLTPITHSKDHQYEDALRKLDVQDYTNQAIEFLCRNVNKNVISSNYLNTIQRSLLYQLLPLLCDGLVVIISFNYILLKEKLRRVSEFISWAAINPEVDEVQVAFIMQNIASKQINLLLIHPDLVPKVSLTSLNIQLLVLDQANYYLPQLDIGKSLCDLNHIIASANAQALHILIPYMQELQLNTFAESNMFSRLYIYYREEPQILHEITSSRDSQAEKSLVTLLRSSRLFKKKGILVYCSHAHSTERTNIWLSQNGFKSCLIDLKKNESHRQQVYYDFAAGAIDILVLQTGFLMPEGLKSFVNLVVYLQTPPNIETFLLDLQELNKDANVHIFLSDEGFIEQRNSLCARFSSVEAISVLLSEIIYSPDLIKNDENDIEYWLLNKWLNKQPSKTNKIKKLALNNSVQKLQMTRQNLFQVLSLLEQQLWIELQVLVPAEVIIYQTEMPEELLYNLTAFGKKCSTSSGIKCSVDDLLVNSNVNPTQLVQYLKSNKVKFEISEESQIIQINHTPSVSELQAKALEIYSTLKRNNLVKINNLDFAYLMGRQNSYKSLDCMWKQIQLQNETAALKSFVTSYIQQKEYLEQSYNTDLPFQKLETQREKSTLLQDLKKLMEYFGQYDFELSWVQIESMATKSLIIFQGLKAGKTPAKSLPQWGKYKAYNYHKLHNAIHELLSEKRELKREPFTVRKKIKF